MKKTYRLILLTSPQVPHIRRCIYLTAKRKEGLSGKKMRERADERQGNVQIITYILQDSIVMAPTLP